MTSSSANNSSILSDIRTLIWLIATSLVVVGLIWCLPFVHAARLDLHDDTAVATVIDAVVPFLFLVIFLFIVFSLLFGVVGWFFKHTFKLAAVSLIACVIGVVSIVGSVKRFSNVRKQVFTEMANRSQPLVEAIKAYHKDTGTPPENLTELVPDYLAKVPSTGVAAHPEYYYSNESATEPNEWELAVSAGFGLNFDLMLYLPHENYPDRGYGGVPERLGNWAYVHE